jgi:hypothetical protein
MKAVLAAVMMLAAVTATAADIPITIHATADSDRLVPHTVGYVAGADGYLDADTGEQVEAVESRVVILATYRLTRGRPVVDVVIDGGIRTQIAAASNPVFDLRIEVPESQFLALYDGNGAGLLAVLAAAGELRPGPGFADQIRAVAAAVLGAR